jgi:hypothetical protein
MSDPINPDHYQGAIECIDALEAAMTPEAFSGFCRGNAFKYLWRAGRKGPALEDAQKAAWYLDRLIRSLETTDGAGPDSRPPG